ncbi:MAG: DUF5597 domain-containing protein, partial [Candidatus Sumerlaeota bacterium]|nr:DUF5597 domain-containing protein [Candidatus Sumerlaeota bacterium]
HKEALLPELKDRWAAGGFKDRWAAGGFKESGAWAEVFGEGIETDEILMAWHYARYIGKIAQAGKDAYPLPMYANAWLEGDGKPGIYPCGGPVSRVMDVWRAAAPALDFIAPDIYLPDFKGICARYTRSGNPLMIPEASRDENAAGRAFWAYAEHDALCFSPFGIESLDPQNSLVETYFLMQPLLPIMSQAQGLGKMAGVFQQPGEKEEGRTVNVGDWRAEIRYEKESKNRRAMGLIIAVAEDEYLVAGIGFSVHFSPLKPGPRNGAILQVQEGYFNNGKWIAGRILNGDETGANNVARIPPFPGDVYSNPGKMRLLRIKLYRYD